jgi:hypothetical protein
MEVTTYMERKGADIMSVNKLKSDIPDEVIESLARCILPSIQAYFESEEGQKEYAEWKTKGKRTA